MMAAKFESHIVFLLLYILSLHAIAIYFFTSGFLLTRNELPLSSHCDDLLEDVGCNLPRHNMPNHKTYDNSSSCNKDSAESESGRCSDQPNVETMLCNVLPASGPSCWTPPAVKKVVILIFDALRFDFVAPSDLYKDKPRPWMDKLQVMQKLLVEESSRAKLFKFIADPPTTSLQRLKGLTTGSLPTFIDVGNSFGAPAIVEDNIIHQLTSNGKKVIMMGDDTWLDLFPSQFSRTFPFPSLNVKDLHTVDDGVIKNLFPALHEDNWDVLIGHFLGVDHVGHIFGVESSHMVEKLEQYNKVVENVISILRDQSHQGGLHDDTLLLVMGDHGQTLNGDHGGGTVEEVETALFAWSSRQPAYPTSQTCHSLCITNPARDNQSCICEFQQLDFAATLAAILGIPFPFGSIGKVNPQLFGLVARKWLPSKYEVDNNNEDDWLALKWLEVYSNVLCLNSWQVNRYFQQYSESVLNGFPMNDILTLHNFYDNARSTSQEWSFLSETPPSLDEAVALLADGVERYTKYLCSAAALARSKWTQFSDESMAFGLVVLLISLVVQMIAVYNLASFGYVSSYVDLKNCRKLLPVQDMIKSGITFGISSGIASTVISVIVSWVSGGSLSLSPRQLVMIIVGGTVVGTTKSYLFKRNIYVAGNTNTENLEDCHQIGHARPDLKGTLAIFFCCIYACSLLSNSFILREHQVVTFLLVSIGVLDLRVATQRKSKVPQALGFLMANFIMSSLNEFNLFKDTAFQTGETNPRMAPSSLTSVIWQLLFLCFTTYVPLAIIGCFLVMSMWRSCLLQRCCSRVVFFGVPLSYAAIFLHWCLDDFENLQLLSISAPTQKFARLQIPRMVYCVVALQSLLLLGDVKDAHTENSNIQLKRVLEDAPVRCLGVWSGLILLLLGKQGPVIALVAGIEGWCLLDKQSLYVPPQKSRTEKGIIVDYSVGTIQWSLFAVQIFFCTGHRCAFDGLHYAAAFRGFDEFSIYQQGALLALETFGASHILPALGLALLVAKRTPTRNISLDWFYKLQMSQAFLLYGLVRTLTAMFTTICVTIQRRHLMVWGLFAPKFVFDAIGLLVTDVVLLLAFSYYMLPFT